MEMNTSGFTMLVRELDEDGHILTERYFGTDGNPAWVTGWYTAVKNEYQDGLKIRTVYLDPEDNPVNCDRGYCEIRYEYQDGKESGKTWWNTDGVQVNEKGEPLPQEAESHRFLADSGIVQMKANP